VRKGFKQLSSAISLLLVLLLLIPLTNSYASANSNVNTQTLDRIKQAYDIAGVTTLWNMGLTGSGMKIGIIDDGIDYKSPDLGGCLGNGCKVAGGCNFDENSPDIMPRNRDYSHGTLLSGQMVANGSMKGVAYEATIYGYSGQSVTHD